MLSEVWDSRRNKKHPLVLHRMALLEGLVILTIVVAAGYVGYHMWQEWLIDEETGESHQVDLQHDLLSQSVVLPRLVYATT